MHSSKNSNPSLVDLQALLKKTEEERDEARRGWSEALAADAGSGMVAVPGDPDNDPLNQAERLFGREEALRLFPDSTKTQQAHEEGTLEPCECGTSQWQLTATLISCRRCGRTWGRVNGHWVFDPTSSPDYTGPETETEREELARFQTWCEENAPSEGLLGDVHTARIAHLDRDDEEGSPNPEEIRWPSGNGGYRVFQWLGRWSWHYSLAKDGYDSCEEALQKARTHEQKIRQLDVDK